MPFAIKLEMIKTGPTGSINIVKYYSQTIETLVENVGLDQIVILTSGEISEEVDISTTLIEAEKKLQELTTNKKYKNVSSIKIVEFPEPTNENKN